jgi:hypothetical protein
VAGNAGTASGPQTFSIDTIAPTALGVALTNDTGSSNTDRITNNAALTLTNLETNATVQYSTNNGQNWTSSFTPAQGNNTILVRQVDVAGNASTSTTFTFAFDTVAPAAATLSLNLDSGTPSDGITNSGVINVAGLEAGSTPAYSLDNGQSWTAFTGTSFTLTGDGTKSVIVRQTDAAGNTSTSNPLGFTLDTLAPAVSITAVGGADGIVSGQANDNTVVGTAEPNRTVTLTAGGTTLGTATADATGSFTYTLSAANLQALGQGGSKSITASQTDLAGNTGTSAAFNFSVDTLAPTVSITAVGGADGIVSGQANDNTVVGTAEPNRTVTLTAGGTTLGTATADATGSFTYALSAANLQALGQGGSKSITASQTDLAGNTGTSTAFNFSVDTSAPTAPSIDAIAGDNIINANEAASGVVLSGAAELGSIINLNIGGLPRTVTATDGTWSYTLTDSEISGLGQGIKTVTVTATDAAGNVSSQASQTFAINTIGLSGINFSDTSIAENSAIDAVATLSSGDSNDVTYSLIGGDGSTDNGDFTINGNQLLIKNPVDFETKSSYSIRIRATDAAGNSTETTQIISVNDVNEAPTAINLNASAIAENAAGAVVGTLTVIDPDLLNAAFRNNTLTVSDERFEVINGELKLKAGQSLNYESLTDGQLTVTVTATDSTLPAGSNSISQAFTINVTDVNEAPELTGTQATLVAGTEDTPYTLTKADLLAGFTDVDGDSLSVSGLTATDGTISANADGTYTFTSAANFNGSVALSYNVIDGKGATVAATQSFSPAAVNDAPALTGTKATLVAGTEDTPYTLTKADLLAGFTDVDGDSPFGL